MRRLSFLLAITTTIFFCTTLLGPDRAYACSCAVETGISAEERIEDAFSLGGAVFSGEAVSIEGPAESAAMSSAAPVTVTFDVSEVWKGPQANTLEATTAVSSASCGYNFQTGEEYLVYASEDLQVSLCSETKPLSTAKVDLEVLGSADDTVGGNGTLPDTSGVTTLSRLAPHTMAGVAGLAAVLVTLAVFIFSKKFLRRP